MNQEIFTTLLKQFTRFVEHLTNDEIGELASGKKRLSIQVVDVKQSSSKKSLSINLQEIADKLAVINSRNEAADLLKNFKKTNLSELAKVLDIPIQRNDDANRLRDKIVESTVGFKLRSQAIQNGDG